MIGLMCIPSLSSILELIGEVIKRLQVKEGACTSSTFDTRQSSSKGAAGRLKTISSFHLDTNSQNLPGYFQILSRILFVNFTREMESVAVNCLLDTGSGCLYLSANVLQDLGLIETIDMDCQIRFSTLLTL